MAQSRYVYTWHFAIDTNNDQVHFLEGRINELATEKERLVGVLHGLRGSVDQTAIVLERSHSRFTRLHDQLSATKNSLNNALLSGSFGVSEWGDQDSQGMLPLHIYSKVIYFQGMQ